MKIRTSISLTADALSRLRIEAKKRDRSVSFIIDEWLRAKFCPTHFSVPGEIINRIAQDPRIHLRNASPGPGGAVILEVEST